MHISKLAAVLPLFALAGCWPYLGSPYEDYVDGEGTTDPDGDSDTLPDRGTDDPDTEGTDDPDTTPAGDGPTLIGVFTTIQFMGGYWGEAPNTGVQSSLLALGVEGLDWDYTSTKPPMGECAGSTTLLDDVEELAIDAGLPSSFDIGTSGRPVPMTTWSDNADVRVGNNEDMAAIPANATVSMDVSSDDGDISGTISRTPSDFTWSEPTVDGDQLLIYPREPFNVIWSGTLNDTVVATWLFQDGDFQTVGGAICTVPAGGFSIDPATAPDGTEFIELRLERIREFSGGVSGSAGVHSVVAGTLEKRGYIALEAIAE